MKNLFKFDFSNVFFFSWCLLSIIHLLLLFAIINFLSFPCSILYFICSLQDAINEEDEKIEEKQSTVSLYALSTLNAVLPNNFRIISVHCFVLMILKRKCNNLTTFQFQNRGIMDGDWNDDEEGMDKLQHKQQVSESYLRISKKFFKCILV